METEVFVRRNGDAWEVIVKFASGYTTQPVPCHNENDAHVYARGIEDGFNHAQFALGAIRNRGITRAHIIK
jgi:hypothetical protein